MSSWLHVGGLPETISVEEVTRRFANFGEVRDVELIMEKFPTLSQEPLCRGFAYVTLETTPVLLEKCISTYSGCTWKGRTLRLRPDKTLSQKVIRSELTESFNTYDRIVRGVTPTDSDLSYFRENCNAENVPPPDNSSEIASGTCEEGTCDTLGVDYKYWYQRHRLFKKWDLGITLDTEAWFSVTPEVIAEHHAVRCSEIAASLRSSQHGPVMLDAFCGAGGNTIQFALKKMNVVAVDNRPETIRIASHNSKVYGVRHNIDFICGDTARLLQYANADIIFLSPPWGGPNYGEATFSLDQIQVSGLNGIELLKCALQVTRNVLYYLPRNVCLRSLRNIGVPMEVERNFLGGKLKAVTLYFGDLVGQTSFS